MKSYLSPVRGALLICLAVIVLAGCVSIERITPSNPATSDAGSNTTPDPSEEYAQELRVAYADFDSYAPSEEEFAKVYELEENGSLYYYAADDKRYIFPSLEIYTSWFKDLRTLQRVPLEEMQKMPLGGNVTVRPFSLITTPSDTNVYLVLRSGSIAAVDRHVLETVFGAEFAKRAIEIPNYYFTNYTYQDSILQVDDFPLPQTNVTIDQDKGFVAQ